MRDPGLEQFELSISSYCDVVLAEMWRDSTFGALHSVVWLYRGYEFRATIREPSESEELSKSDYKQWRKKRGALHVLPSRPVFQWRSPGSDAWQTAKNLVQWQRVLESIGPDEPDNLAGRAVRPLPRPPSLYAAAEAIPEE